MAEGDFHARDIMYHSSCKLWYWSTYVQAPEKLRTSTDKAKNDDAHDTLSFIAAEIEFYDELQDRLDSGEYLDFCEVEELYYSVMKDHDVSNQTRRSVLRDKIKKNIIDIDISEARGCLPPVINSKKATRVAVDVAQEKDDRGDLNIIFQCARIVRRAIADAANATWVFKGSLLESPDHGIPVELLSLIRWILQGAKVAPSESRNNSLHRSCVMISHTIMQECKTDKQVLHKAKTGSALSGFRRRMHGPFAIGLSLWMYHNFRSEKAVNILNSSNVGVPYKYLTHICGSLAKAVQLNVEEHGVYVPHGIMKNITIRASADNVDKKVDTYDAKDSFHGMAMCVHQRVTDGTPVVAPLDLYKISPSPLQGAPKTVIELQACNIAGNPKPLASPIYKTYKMGVHEEIFTSAEKIDLVWMLSRSFRRHWTVVNNTHSTTGMPPLSEEGDSSQQPDTPVIAEGSNHIPDPTETDSPEQPIAVTTEEGNCTPEPIEVDSSGPPNIPVGRKEGNYTPEPKLDSSSNSHQMVPVWSAYNSLLTPASPVSRDEVFSLPIINAPAHEWPTLVTTMEQLCKLNERVCGGSRKMTVTFDMDLYKRVLKLPYLDSKYVGKWVLCPGAFHIELCALRCLGKTIEGSGLDEAWVESGVYSTITVEKIINGGHLNRAYEAHLISLQTLFDLWLDGFFVERPAVREALLAAAQRVHDACLSHTGIVEAHQTMLATLESLNIYRQLTDYDACHIDDPMFQWARLYMRQVLTLLQFRRATRGGDWFLYLSSLEKLCVYFFAYNRLDYAQNIPEYVARMYQLQTEEPTLWNEFVSGDFSVNTTNHVPFTRIGIDQFQEHQNKKTKGRGGISGITQNPSTLLKFCLCGPELARLVTETESMLGMSDQMQTSHHALGQSQITRQEDAIKKLHTVLESCHIFRNKAPEDGTPPPMFKLISKELVPKNVQESILGLETRGAEVLKVFVSERVCGKKNMWDKMAKSKYLSWGDSSKKVNMKGKTEVLTLRATTSTMARLLIIARSTREIDLEKVIGRYDFTMVNRTLLQPDGSLDPTTDKSDIIHVLEDLVKPDLAQGGQDVLQHNADVTPESFSDHHIISAKTCLVIDGMAVVAELTSVKSFKTCEELGDAYVQLIENKAKKYSHARIIFDNYNCRSSLKEFTRERRRGGKNPVKGYIVEDATKIKNGNTKVFLASIETKDSLTKYLAQKLIDKCCLHIITATRHSVMSNNLTDVVPGVSSQEEADTVMILHAVDAAKAGFTIHVYSQDTDVLLLALRRVPELGPETTMIMGTGDMRRLIKLQPIFNILGPDKAKAAIKAHSLTGCDTTGRINGKSKKKSFQTFLAASADVIQAISKLGIGSEPSEDAIEKCQVFLCSLFCKKDAQISKPEDLRWEMFKDLNPDQGVDKLPPTPGAWLQHILRAHVQSSVWEHDLQLDPEPLDPLKLGWICSNDQLVPVLSLLPPAPESVVELVRCKCGVSNPESTNKCASKRCSCKVKNLPCTELCKCSADTDLCQNIYVHGEDDS